MFPYFILIEGIDGSGKDTFANLLREVIYQRFRYDLKATLSIVGQPCFRFDKDGKVRQFIEKGEITEPYEVIVEKLTENRMLHEQYLLRYNGFIICIRGLLTDLGTLMRLYNKIPDNNLGQNRNIDQLIIVDVSPYEARKRIEERGILPTWRESIDNLTFFRDFFLNNSKLPLFFKSTVIQNFKTDLLKHTAIKVVEEICSNFYLL